MTFIVLFLARRVGKYIEKGEGHFVMLIEVYMHLTECYPHGKVVDPGVFNKTIILLVLSGYACCESRIPRESERLRNLWESTYTWCRVQKSTLDYIGGG